MYVAIFMRLGMLLFMTSLGVLARKTKLFEENAHKTLSAIVFNISLPFMVFCSISSVLTPSILQKAGIVLIIALCFYLSCLLLSTFYVKLLRLKEEEKGIHQYCFIFSNIAFIGIPLVKAFWGDEGIIYASIIVVVFSSFNNSIGIALLSHKRKTKGILQIFKSPPFLGAVAGIVFGLLEIQIPEIVFSNMLLLGNTTTPLAMLFIGHMLAGANISRIGQYKVFILTTIFRLVIIPAACYLILRSITSDFYAYSVPTLIAAMPFSTTLTIFAEKQGADIEAASFATLFSTLGSIITIPIWALILI